MLNINKSSNMMFFPSSPNNQKNAMTVSGNSTIAILCEQKLDIHFCDKVTKFEKVWIIFLIFKFY